MIVISGVKIHTGSTSAEPPKQVVSTKYAPHLASCLGFGGATRRGGRSAAAKVRMGNYDRSSPISWQSENGDSDVDSVNGSKNGKSESNTRVSFLPPASSLHVEVVVSTVGLMYWWIAPDQVVESKVNANGKRGMSPSKPPIGKKHKLAGMLIPTEPFNNILPT